MSSPPASRPFPVTLSVASGLLMGSADAVPGVSGGTIALIIGVYNRFIHALSIVVRSPRLITNTVGRRQLGRAVRFLVPLGCGLIASYYGVTKLLVGPSEAPGVLLRPQTAPVCYAFFFGLVLASIREPWKRIDPHTIQHIVLASMCALLAYLFVGLPYQTTSGATWTLAIGGAGAIAVMLLPGVSGSLFLVIIGQYTLVAGAIHDRNFAAMAIFIFGMGLGVATAVPVLQFCLRQYHNKTMAALTGFMAGSLRALWPWKSHYNPKQTELGPMRNLGVGDDLPYVLLAAVAGIAVVWLLTKLEQRILSADKNSQRMDN